MANLASVQKHEPQTAVPVKGVRFMMIYDQKKVIPFTKVILIIHFLILWSALFL